MIDSGKKVKNILSDPRKLDSGTLFMVFNLFP